MYACNHKTVITRTPHAGIYIYMYYVCSRIACAPTRHTGTRSRPYFAAVLAAVLTSGRCEPKEAVWVCGCVGELVCRVCHRCIMSVECSLLVLSCVCCCDVHLFFHTQVYKTVRDRFAQSHGEGVTFACVVSEIRFTHHRRDIALVT